MADRISSEARSANMRRVKGRDTKPEVRVRRLLHRLGYRFRLHRRDLPGTPDLYLPKHRLVIFVNGCFWHGHDGCKRAKLPETRRDFWQTKINLNKRRDAASSTELARIGIEVVTLWECELGDDRTIIEAVERVTRCSTIEPTAGTRSYDRV